MKKENPKTQRRWPSLWGLRLTESRRWLLAIDCAGDPILAFLSKEDAELGRKAQRRYYGIKSKVSKLTRKDSP